MNPNHSIFLAKLPLAAPIHIETKFMTLTELALEDSALVVGLRSSRDDSVLSPVQNSISKQDDYFRKYSQRRAAGEEIYFKICNGMRPAETVGLVRITAMDAKDRFSWESFIVKKGVSPVLSIDAIVTVYSLGFLSLQKSICGPWRVPKSGSRVAQLHRTMGMAELIGEDEDDYIFVVLKDSFLRKLQFFHNNHFGISKNIELWGF